MSDFKYVGSELDLFAEVVNWKAYWSSQLRPFIQGDVVEAGAGIGSNTGYLAAGGGTGSWVCLEPDPQLIARLAGEAEKAVGGGRKCETVCGTLSALAGRQFDTIVYIDVLEHIEDDCGEMQRAASCLRPGGRIIVLSPAHQRLFTPFDAGIGHFRRYDKPMMRAVSPPGMELERLRYLDSVGLLASTANLLLLRQSLPTKGQLKLWDGWMVPVSRLIDPLFFYAAGKTIIGVWRKPAA